MKRVAKILSSLLLCMLISSPVFAQKKLVFSTPGNEGNQLFDQGYQIMTKVYKELGYGQIKLKNAPALRSLKIANNGATDGALLRVGNLSEKYKNLIQVPEPVMSFECGFATYKKSIEIKNTSEFEKYLVGAVRGRYWQKPYLNGSNEIIFNDYSKAVKVLRADRLDLLLMHRFAFDYLSPKEKEGLKFNKIPGAKFALYHYLHKKNAHLVEKVSKALQKLKRK